MRLIPTTLLMLALGGGIALAQTSGGAPSGPSTAPSPGAAPATPGNPPVTQPGGAPRTNTEIFPPSRGLQSPAPRATSPGGISQPGGSSGSATTSTPGAPQPRTSQPEASGGSRPQPGGANSSAQSGDKRTGKNAVNEEYADCMRLWEPATHMTKQEWSRTCRRVQSRLDQAQIK